MLNQILIEEFGKRIRQLRTERNLSQEELSFLTGFLIAKMSNTYDFITCRM